jgi:hypothetical protein
MNPARSADEINSLKENFLIAKAKYRICRAACDARSISAPRVSTSAAESAALS